MDLPALLCGDETPGTKGGRTPINLPVHFVVHGRGTLRGICAATVLLLCWVPLTSSVNLLLLVFLPVRETTESPVKS